MSDQQTPGNHRLIDGIFGAEDARHLLMTLINNKIQFHEQESWSQKERFGDSHPASSGRVQELIHTREDLAALIDRAQARGERLSINCTIEVTPLPG